ncbi:hypothetical protein [Hymenobacter cheonanensis]|uniref:hypothetical protein n=1 Tax=Hymenobacter sp. CA2-7 TaxID=3063993 RepID=UPI002712BA07|nr:hypothetical protein [Hymenobacter sp. CA2-7]MDO7888200.1 hypothetical protein [Hymenobacter sp. CA2-7]
MAKAPYTQELLDRAQAHVQRPLNDRRYAEGLSEIAQLYADITGEPVGKCRQCQYKDFLAVVTAYIREATRSLHPELMADSKYTFAPGFAGEVIADGRYSKTVTAENLTDQDAEALIKYGYGHVIVLKPGQESLLAGASDQGSTDEGDDEPETEPSAREIELQTQLEASQKSFLEVEATQKDALEELYKERRDHAVTRSQLTETQQQLTAAKAKLSRKTATTGATDPATVPAVSTSDATATPSAPAVTAPAPPVDPAPGTSGN